MRARMILISSGSATNCPRKFKTYFSIFNTYNVQIKNEKNFNTHIFLHCQVGFIHYWDIQSFQRENVVQNYINPRLKLTRAQTDCNRNPFLMTSFTFSWKKICFGDVSDINEKKTPSAGKNFLSSRMFPKSGPSFLKTHTFYPNIDRFCSKTTTELLVI